MMTTDMSKLIRNTITILSIFMLAGCSLLSPVKVDTQNKFILNKVPDVVPARNTHSTILLVSAPEARPILNTTQMAYTIKPYQISYFSQNQWAETPGEMLQPLLVQTLQNTHYFKAIVTPPYIGHYDYTLNTQILELMQDFTHRTPTLIMTVRAQIIRFSNNQIIGTKQFSVTLPIPQGSPYGGVYAANYASALILERISVFCLDKIQGRARH